MNDELPNVKFCFDPECGGLMDFIGTTSNHTFIVEQFQCRECQQIQEVFPEVAA